MFSGRKRVLSCRKRYEEKGERGVMPRHGLGFHDCVRFWDVDLPCPFSSPEEEKKRRKERVREREEGEKIDRREEEVRERELVPVVPPARRRRNPRVTEDMQRRMERLLELPLLAVGEPDLKKALERMRNVQSKGGLTSIPNVERTLQLPELGPQELIGVLVSIAISAFLFRLPGMRHAMSLLGVQLSERHVGEGLRKRLASPAEASGKVDGEFRKLMGFEPKRREFELITFYQGFGGGDK